MTDPQKLALDNFGAALAKFRSAKNDLLEVTKLLYPDEDLAIQTRAAAVDLESMPCPSRSK